MRDVAAGNVSSVDLGRERSGRRFTLFLAACAAALLASGGPANAITIGGTDYVHSGPSEDLSITFTAADAGTTANTYSGFVQVTVSGVGESAGTRLNDAFYVFTDPAHNLIAPFNDPQYYQLAFDTVALVPFNPSRDIKDFIVYDLDGGIEVTPAYVPAYRPDHTYAFVIDVGAGGILHFGTSDGNFSDNSGSHSIHLAQLAPIPEPSGTLLFCIGSVAVGLAIDGRRRRA